MGKLKTAGKPASILYHPAFGGPPVTNPIFRGRKKGVASLDNARRKHRVRQRWLAEQIQEPTLRPNPSIPIEAQDCGPLAEMIMHMGWLTSTEKRALAHLRNAVKTDRELLDGIGRAVKTYSPERLKGFMLSHAGLM